MMTSDEKDEKLAALTERYRAGELSEPVFEASILSLVPDPIERRYLIHLSQPYHRQSMAYKRRHA